MINDAIQNLVERIEAISKTLEHIDHPKCPVTVGVPPPCIAIRFLVSDEAKAAIKKDILEELELCKIRLRYLISILTDKNDDDDNLAGLTDEVLEVEA